MSIPYKRVLLPLDGSKLSEVAVPHAVGIAESSGAELVLLRVVLAPPDEVLCTDGEPIVLEERLEARRAQAFECLEEVRHRISGRHLHIHTAVVVGPPADGILEYARAHAIDAIVMATHGRSGPSRWLLGSVAEKVVHASDAPVLLVRSR